MKTYIAFVALVSFLAGALTVWWLWVPKGNDGQLANGNQAAVVANDSGSVANSIVAQPSAPGKPWAQFRGTNGQGDGSASVVPASWSNTENMIWKTRLLGRGASTPIVVGENVFLTAYSGYGIKAGDKTKKEDLRLHMICFDRNTGQQKWIRSIAGSNASQNPSENFLMHGSASSTPVCDGERVYGFFGVSGVFAFDLAGNFVWQADVGATTDNFGSSASPMIHGDLLIVNAGIESGRMFAFDKLTGTIKWIVDDVGRTWSTPVIGKSAEGRTELILNQAYFVRGFDPESGEELWRCDGVQDYVVPIANVQGNMVYCSGGKQARIMCIRLGGSGDVTSTHKLWESPLVGNVPTPVFHDGSLYVVGENGILQQFAAATGKPGFKKRVKSKQKVFSPLVKSRNYFFVSTPGLGVSVIDRKNDFKVISVNRPDPDSAVALSCCSISGDRLYYRTDDWLYCVGKNSSAPQQSQVTLDETKDVLQPKKKYAINEQNGKPKLYVRYMTGSKQDTCDIVLRPYQSIITPGAEREALDELVGSHWEEYVVIRADEKAALLEQNKVSDEQYIKLFADIEKRMMALDAKVRGKVRPTFSKEQMAQHMKEHNAWLEKQKKSNQK